MTDEDWMALALQEARKGVGRTAPNPPVGAVVVKDGKFLGTGWHRRAGLPHAEVEAMAAAELEHGKGCLAGATVYVTLEPCSTVGKTPTCTGGLIHAGVSRVVYGCADPNPSHAGAADDILKKAGITVRARVLEKECGVILRPFAKAQRTGLPWVIWKCAMSLDGRITRPEGEGQWLSGAEARGEVQRLRAEVDAILTSGETVRRDKPSLTIRVPELLEGREQPWRVILTDRPESMPDDAPLFNDELKNRTLIRSGGLEEALRELVKERGVLSVMLEAGGKLSAAMFAAGLVDEAVIYHAPILCGGGTLLALAGEVFPDSVELREVTWKNFGADRRVRGLIGKKHE